jgi:dolichol kinase
MRKVARGERLGGPGVTDAGRVTVTQSTAVSGLELAATPHGPALGRRHALHAGHGGTLLAGATALPRGLRAEELVPDVASSYVPGRTLDACEVRRRMLHMLPGFLPFILWFIPHPDPWGPIAADVVIGLTVLIVGTSLLRFSAFARDGESDGRASILGYAFPVLAALCLFRGREELGVMTLAILAFGDGSATLGGMTLGGYRLPWNPKKTVTGLLCFICIGGPLASLVFWGETRPGVSLGIAATCGFAATLTAAIAESVPSKINDNLRVGVTSVLAGALFQRLVVG